MKGETCFPVNVVRIFFFPSSSSPTSPVMWIVVVFQQRDEDSSISLGTKKSICGLLSCLNNGLRTQKTITLASFNALLPFSLLLFFWTF